MFPLNGVELLKADQQQPIDTINDQTYENLKSCANCMHSILTDEEDGFYIFNSGCNFGRAHCNNYSLW